MPPGPPPARPPASVSVVIPTRGRPQLLLRAIASVQHQTLPAQEIIVAIDGEDPATDTVLAGLGEPRLKVLRLPASGRPGRLRNAGAAAAAGRWVAFLDDDDAWLPDKLARQVAAAEAAGNDALIACRAQIETPTGRYVWPRRPPAPGEPLSEYLFLRRTLFKGEGFIQSSGLFAARTLLARVPFDDALQAFEDWDWVIRAAADPDCRFAMVFEPLYIHYTEERRASLSSRFDLEGAFGWLRSRRSLLSRRAYAGFCLVMISAEPALRRDWSAGSRLLAEAFRGGRPTLFNLLLFLGMWLVPRDLRRRLRRLTGREARLA